MVRMFTYGAAASRGKRAFTQRSEWDPARLQRRARGGNQIERTRLIVRVKLLSRRGAAFQLRDRDCKVGCASALLTSIITDAVGVPAVALRRDPSPAIRPRSRAPSMRPRS